MAPPTPPEVTSNAPSTTAANPVNNAPSTTASNPASVAAPSIPPEPPVAIGEPTQSQQEALKSLQAVNGDIDGMQAPPLDLGPALANPSTASSPSTDTGLTLPPIQDKDVLPPKDLDLPPADDLGNLNLNSRNK
jgi:hypothetical protein